MPALQRHKSPIVVHVSIHSSTNQSIFRKRKRSRRNKLRNYKVKTHLNTLSIPTTDEICKRSKRNYELEGVKDLSERKKRYFPHKLHRRPIFQCCCLFIATLFLLAALLAIILGITLTRTTTKTTTTTTEICTPFWKMPLVDQGTYLNYSNVNTRISNDDSRSVCVTFRATSVNLDDIIFDIGSRSATPTGGCNAHFALAVSNNDCVTVYGMCGAYDNGNICFGKNVLHDGQFHQVCATYDTTTAKLCLYLDLYSPQCLIRSNVPYNTSLGDVRIGWWPDLNRPFDSSGGGLIKWLYMFDKAVNQTCISYHYHNYFISNG